MSTEIVREVNKIISQDIIHQTKNTTCEIILWVSDEMFRFSHFYTRAREFKKDLERRISD